MDNETAALQTLLDYAPRYAQVVQSTPMAFVIPEDTAVFNVVERLAGNATTDFGVPEQPAAEEADPNVELARTRQAILDALTTAVTEGLPEKGPRGGKLWLPRYFVRRVAWHVLDHTWEIEDRII